MGVGDSGNGIGDASSIRGMVEEGDLGVAFGRETEGSRSADVGEAAGVCSSSADMEDAAPYSSSADVGVAAGVCSSTADVGEAAASNGVCSSTADEGEATLSGASSAD